MIGVDPAPRLLTLARRRADQAGLTLDFQLGEAARIPLPDDSTDAIVSVFGVIFAPDATTAAAEMTRVLRPGGRLMLAAWTPEDAPAGPGPLRREALSAAGHDQPVSHAFAWHDPAALNNLFEFAGMTFTIQRADVTITADSPQAYAEADLASHPLWVDARSVLEPAGRWENLREQVIQLQTEVNEDPMAFRITCPYVIATGVLPQ
ncbi:hypothetical protein Kisp02_27270 [Kineosporia sp. NBRC 101731]|nr:hypothetical protein Kisp02_27270 [Kineosporia sp. NBRC 101731]